MLENTHIKQKKMEKESEFRYYPPQNSSSKFKTFLGNFCVKFTYCDKSNDFYFFMPNFLLKFNHVKSHEKRFFFSKPLKIKRCDYIFEIHGEECGVIG